MEGLTFGSEAQQRNAFMITNERSYCERDTALVASRSRAIFPIQIASAASCRRGSCTSSVRIRVTRGVRIASERWADRRAVRTIRQPCGSFVSTPRKRAIDADQGIAFWVHNRLVALQLGLGPRQSSTAAHCEGYSVGSRRILRTRLDPDWTRFKPGTRSERCSPQCRPAQVFGKLSSELARRVGDDLVRSAGVKS